MSNSQEDFPINHPLNIHSNITLTPEEAKTGVNKIVEVQGRKLSVKIPPDVKDGAKVRAKGKGKNENPEGQTGDLYLIVGIEGTSQRGDWTSSSPIQYPVISVSRLEGKVTVTKPRIEFKKILQEWIQKQDKHWPQEQLTIDVLSKNIICYYLDQWILEGSASGNWSASIGTSQQKISTCNNCYGKGGWYDMWKEWHKCPTCGTSGKVVENFTSWHSQSGIASGEINGKVIENITGGVNIQCGKRDLKSEELLFSPAELSSMQVFQPKSIDEESGRTIAENLIHDNLHRDANHSASRLGSVRDLKVGYVKFEKINARHWLYPIFVGDFPFEGKNHTIQIDGVTGNVFIEVPESIRSARWNETMKIVSSVIGYIAVLFLIIYGISALVNLFTK